MNAEISNENQIAKYLLNSEPIIGSAMKLKKNGLGVRRINFILNNSFLRLALPSGMPGYYYSQRFHKLRIKASYRAARDIAEELIHPSAYGYQREKTHHAAVKRIQAGLREGYPYIVRFDFRDFFDSINLEQLDIKLQEALPNDPELRKFLIRLQRIPSFDYQYSQVVQTMGGVRQGLAPATLLANLYLADFDAFCATQSPYYIRFVDDGALCFRDEIEAIAAKCNIQLYLANNYPSLKLHPEKTKVVSSNELDLLGYVIKPGTLDWTLSEFAKWNLQSNFRRMLDKWEDEPRIKRAPEVKNFKKLYKSALSSIQLQLSVVKDQVLTDELWASVCQSTIQTFNTLYSTMHDKRKALKALGFSMGMSNALLKGRFNVVPAAPFSTTSLLEVLIQNLQTQNAGRRNRESSQLVRNNYIRE